MIQKLLDSWKVITIIIAMLSTGAWFSVTNATQDDIIKVEKTIQLVGLRLDQKIQNDQTYNLQERVWKLEDRHSCIDLAGCKFQMSPTQYNEYRILRTRLKCLQAGKGGCS